MMTSSFARPSNLHVEDLGDKLCITVNLAKVNQVSSDTTKLSITAYYNDDCTVDQEFVSHSTMKDALVNSQSQNESKLVTFYKPKCRPANITLMVMESLVDGSEIELGQATVHAICYPEAPVLSVVSNGVSKLDDVDSHKVKTSGVKLRVNLSNDGGFQFKSVHFFVNKKDNSNSPIVKLPPIMLSEDDIEAGFAVVTLPDVVTVADKKISINASVDNVAGLESNVSSVSVVVSNAIRPHAVEMASAESCRNSAVPVHVKVGVKDGAYASVLARADHDECWSTTNVLNVSEGDAFSAVVTHIGEQGDELLPFVKYHFAAVQHGSLKLASDDVCTIASLMPDQSKLSNAVSAIPFADFHFSCELSLAAAGALSLDSAGALHVAPSLAVSNMKSGEDFCSVWKFKQNGAVLDSVNSCDHAPPAFYLDAFEYTDALELCVDFYKMVPGEVAESVNCDAVMEMEAVSGRPGKCLHVSSASLAFRPPPSSKAIPVPHALMLEFYNKALFVHHEDPLELMKQQQLSIQSIEYQVSNSAEFGEDSLQFLSDDKKTSVVVHSDAEAGIAGDAEAGGIAEKSKHLLLYSGDKHVKSLASEDSFYVRARYVVSFLNSIVLQSEWNEPAHSGMVTKHIKVTSITLKQTPPRDFNSLTTSFLSLVVEASVDVGHQMVQDISVFVLVKHGANSHKAELLYDPASNVWRSAVLSPTPKVDYSLQPVHVVAVGPLNMDVKTL